MTKLLDFTKAVLDYCRNGFLFSLPEVSKGVRCSRYHLEMQLSPRSSSIHCRTLIKKMKNALIPSVLISGVVLLQNPVP